MFWTKKWGILIKKESESLDFTGLKIPRDYKYKMEAAGVYPAETNMGLTEILLILLGILVFVASFILPENIGKDTAKEVKIPEEKIKELIEQEVKQAAFHIEEKTDETISAAAQKTERYMERLSNEKIMAIQEYSDTVLGQINRNHEEAVFLYDMLNNKHTQVKNAAVELDTVMRNMKINIENTTQDISQDFSTDKESVCLVAEVKREKQEVNKECMENNNSTDNNGEYTEDSDAGIPFKTEDEKGNKKNKILKLHEEGMSNIEIAKNLGLGIGEVKLVIDLYESGE